MKKYKELFLRFIPIVLVMILTIGLSELFYQSMISSTREKCLDEVTAAHTASSREIENRLTNNSKMLDLAASAILLNADFENEEAVLEYLASVKSETVFDRIDVVYPDGTILAETGKKLAYYDHHSYQDLVAKGTHPSRRVADYLTGEPVIHVFSPVHDEAGEPIAILEATVHCATLAQVFTSSYYGEDAKLFLVDLRDGNLVLDDWHESPGSIYDMRIHNTPESHGGRDFISEIMEGGSGTMSYSSQAYGSTSYAIYAPVEDTQYTLTMVVQEDVVFADVYEMKQVMTWVGVVEVALLLFFGGWIYFILRKSMENENRAQKAELSLLHQKEKDLEHQYSAAANRQSFLEVMAKNLPGGYHRCTTDHEFRLTFVSNSFTQITGYTLEQVNEELGGSYMGLVAPVDQAYFMSLAPQLETKGYIHCAYRMRRRDGSIRWVKDSTQYVERDGEQYYQCSLVDIHDIILKQEELARQANLLDTLEANMPGGYHRCADAPGWPFLYISDSFEEVTGWTREEIRSEFDNLFINMVLPEDIPLCANIVEELQHKGYSNAMYRLKKKGGGNLWITDSTMRVELDQERFYQGVLADVTRQIEEMERAKQAAEASSQAKSTFLFNISHDIRTPMNAIKGFSRIIEENAQDPQLVLDAVGKIHQAGDSLMMLMNDVLDIARIERGKEELNLQPMDLKHQGQSLYEMFAADMEAAGIQFRMDAEPDSDYVYCDNLKMTRIMMNMLSNAKKFTPAGGMVCFGSERLRKDEKTCTYRFYVRDTGIGMSPEFLKRAFEQFERERTSTESGVTGSGLGLAIIKMLVEFMGGTVQIQSTLGKGTEISAILTFQLADRVRLSQSGAQSRDTWDPAGKRILLVEDNDFNREIARYILEGMEFAVEEAENGAVCMEKLRCAGPGYYDLILMDIQMPVMNGYTATLEIRNLRDRALAEVPIVAMTANAFEEDKQKCLEVGMNGHIGKPISMAELTQVLSGVFPK